VRPLDPSTDGVRAVRLAIPDLDATLRERRLPLASFEEVRAGGYSFCNVVHKWDTRDVVYEEGAIADEAVSIDLDSWRRDPFEDGCALVLCDFAGPSAGRSPRVLLQRQIERAAARGLVVRAGFEHEFLVLDETPASLRAKGWRDLVPYARENRCWSGTTAASESAFVRGLEDALEAGGVALWALGMELGPGCFESTLRAGEPLRAADDAVLLRHWTRVYCRRRDLTACFVAKLGEEWPGLSGHLHLSLADRASGRPLFASDPAKPSTALRAFVGGVLALAPELFALFAHTVNAYRRFAPGNWAPRTPTWGVGNYSVAVRAVVGTGGSDRIELRLPGSDANPYLALAACLGAGLRGLERDADPGPLQEGDAREVLPPGRTPLPRELGEAVDRLERSAVAAELFGEEFVRGFVASRRHEIDVFRRHVSPFERARYLEVF
jgi:glutamine synthetase